MTVFEMIMAHANTVKNRFLGESFLWAHTDIQVEGHEITFTNEDGELVAKVDFMTNEVIYLRCEPVDVYDALKFYAELERD